MSNALKGLLWLIIVVVVLAGGYALYTLLRPTGAEPAAPAPCIWTGCRCGRA